MFVPEYEEIYSRVLKYLSGVARAQEPQPTEPQSVEKSSTRGGVDSYRLVGRFLDGYSTFCALVCSAKLV